MEPFPQFCAEQAGAGNEMRTLNAKELDKTDTDFSAITRSNFSECSTSTTSTYKTFHTVDGKEICKTTTIVSRVSVKRLDLLEQSLDERITLEPQGQK